MIQRILAVDDDAALLTILSAALTAEGFEIDTASDGAAALERLETKPDLVILDVLLPEIDGLAVCRRIRERGRTPVILLSSRGEELDRVAGLDTGADDYVTKPFSTRELCARIRALDRRMNGAAERPPIRAGELHIDPARFEVHWRGQEVPFTRSELELLLALVERRGFVLPRNRLLDLARGDEVTVTERTVDTFIKRIRKKLGPDFAEIETVFGVGYRYKK